MGLFFGSSTPSYRSLIRKMERPYKRTIARTPKARFRPTADGQRRHITAENIMRIFPHPLTLVPIRFIDRSGKKAHLHEGDEIRLSSRVPSLHIHDATGRPLLFHDPSHKPPINTYLSLPDPWVSTRESRVMLARLMAVAAGLATTPDPHAQPSATHFHCIRPEIRPRHLSLEWTDIQKPASVGHGRRVQLDPQKNTIRFLEEHPTVPNTLLSATFISNHKILGSELELPTGLKVQGNELLLAQLLALAAGCEVMSVDRAYKEETGIHDYGFDAAEQFTKLYAEPVPVQFLREFARHTN